PGLLQDIAALQRKVAEQNDRRVLMVAYYFPPLSGSGVFRSIKFAKYLPLFGWQPTVISTDRPPIGWNYADESQVKEIPEGTEVIRVPDKIGTGRETTLNADRVKELLDFLGDILPYSAKADIIFTQALQTIESAKYLVTFPCNALSWACDTAHYIEKNMDLNRFQAIYTTSGPRSAHLVGFYLKQKYGIPWVADYRDQWTFNPYGEKYDPNNVRQLLLFELESILLHQADCNLTIGDSLIQSYAEEFHLPREKIVSITNGYDESDFAALQAPQGRTDKFTINYSGLLYTQQRSIAPILTAIQQLSDEKKIKLPNVRFRIVGDAEDGSVEVAEQYGLTQIIERTGYLSHRQALQANVDANVLLLLVGDEARFKQGYTGKIFEYLRSGRPILALAPEDGVVDQLLRESGHGEAMLSTQTSRIKSMILREYEKWERGEGQELLHSPVIDRFERRILTEQLADVLSNVVNKDDSSPVTGGEPQPSQEAKYLVICNGGYPIEGYPRCIFAHDRVLQYAKAGVKVDAFGFIWGSPLVTYEYEGVNVTQGGAPELQELLQRKKYEKLLIHVIDEAVMYAIKKAGMQDMPMIIWCHGYEVMPWYRCWFNYTPEELRRNSLTMESENRGKQHFLKQIYAQDNIHFVFVSAWQMGRSKKYV
ncbi:MAG: hypothetical protein K2K53_03595, partial [Oscillospiraceae bacterium]|nr:hypothetical protein [Oscillospiraceae bacterium]